MFRRPRFARLGRVTEAGTFRREPRLQSERLRTAMLTLDLPDHVTEARARLLLALGLFREDEVSVGKAAEIAGLSYRAFLDELRERGIPAFVYDEEMLAEDLAFVRRFKEERGL